MGTQRPVEIRSSSKSSSKKVIFHSIWEGAVQNDPESSKKKGTAPNKTQKSPTWSDLYIYIYIKKHTSVELDENYVRRTHRAKTTVTVQRNWNRSELKQQYICRGEQVR